jgi:8-oxo-dGTP pyrophosphatase MutT (NUDIX family)
MTQKRIIDVIYALQSLVWKVVRPHTRGVKIMVFNTNGELALIRNAYGRSDLFVLPGGGVRPFEEPAKAAVREVKEELGLEITKLKLRSQYLSTSEGKRDEIHLFEALAHGTPQLDNFEVEEVRFVALEDLPSATSPATRRRIEEYLGSRAMNRSW